MLGLLLFLLCLLFGAVIIRRMPLQITLLELLALSGITGIILGAYALLLPVLILGYTYGVTVGAAVLLVGGLWIARTTRWERIPQFQAVGWLVVLLFFGGILLYFNVTHDLQPKADGLYSAGDTWGDIALHLTLASNFALTKHFSADFPLLFGAKLTYPFLLDFLTGQLYRLGLPWGLSFVLPSATLAFVIVQLLLSICYRIFGSLRSGVIATLLIFGSGSAAGWLRAGLTLQPLQDFSHIPALNLQFTNLITSVLLPQRGIAVGIAEVLLVLFFIQSMRPSQPVWLVGVLTGCLPLFHVHSWLVAEMLLVGWAVLSRSKSWTIAAFIGAALAAPALVWQITNTPIHGFIHAHIGWMRADDESVLLFWMKNFGLFLPLFLVIGWMVAKGDALRRLLWVVGAGLFAVTNLLILQPNPYDNIKLLVYWYLLGAILLAGWIAAKNWRLLLLAPLCVTGLLSLLYDGQRSDLLVTNASLAFARSVTEQVPEGSRILTGQQHNDPVTMLSGRPVVEGYPGWLWTYGYNYLPIQEDVDMMYANTLQAKELFKKYQVHFIERDGVLIYVGGNSSGK